MPARTPISHHLDLYAYWLSKRGARIMPARSDIDPVDIPHLLPHLTIAERAGDQFRYRLVGTGVVWDSGREATGGLIGSGLGSPETIADARAFWEGIFAAARPIFVTAEFCFESGANLSVSTPILPLSSDGVTVDMSISSVVTRFDLDLRASRDWLKGVPVKTSAVSEIGSTEELAKLCREWDKRCELRTEERSGKLAG
jgi:hypothetical protein